MSPRPSPWSGRRPDPCPRPGLPSGPIPSRRLPGPSGAEGAAPGVLPSLARAALLLLGLFSGVVGCSPGLIPNTEVPDTEVNRRIVAVVEAYRRAMEARNPDALRALVSRRYYENASTTATTDDDWGYPDLDQVLGRFKEKVKTVNYEIRIKRIEVSGPRADVDYEYTWNFQFDDGGGRERWAQKTDVNRLELIVEDGAWKILSGM